MSATTASDGGRVADELRGLRCDVAAACRVLASEGYSDLTLGHVSARVPGRDAALIKRKGIALDEVTADDVVMVDLDGRALEDGAELHLETALHTEVYKVRPDVGAVVHGHPLHATALAATGARLEMLSHDAVLFADGLPRYEASPDLIISAGEGASVAAALGTCRAVLMRNHGVFTIGATAADAVKAAVMCEDVARTTHIARQLGDPLPIAQADVDSLYARYQNVYGQR